MSKWIDEQIAIQEAPNKVPRGGRILHLVDKAVDARQANYLNVLEALKKAEEALRSADDGSLVVEEALDAIANLGK